MVQLVKIIPDPADLLSGTRKGAESVPQLRLEDILVYDGGGRNAQGGADGSECVGGRGDDGLLRVVDGGDAGQEGDGQHGAVAGAGEEEGRVGHPARAVGVEGGDEGTAGDEGDEGGDAEAQVPARPLHEDAGADGADGDAQGAEEDAEAGLGGGVAEDLEVDGDVEGEDGVGHGTDQVGHAGGEDGPVDEEADGDDGLGVAALPQDEADEQDQGEGQRGQDEGVGPGDEVPAGVEAEEQDDEEGHGQEGAEEVDTREVRLVRGLGGHPDEEGDEQARDDDDGHLDEKGEAPAPGGVVVDDTAKDAAQHGAGAETDIADALDDAPLAQGDEVGGQESRDGHEAAAADAGDDAAEDHDAVGPGETADEVPAGEEDVTKDQAGATAKDIGQAARDGLTGGVGDQVGGGEPGEQA